MRIINGFRPPHGGFRIDEKLLRAARSRLCCKQERENKERICFSVDGIKWKDDGEFCECKSSAWSCRGGANFRDSVSEILLPG